MNQALSLLLFQPALPMRGVTVLLAVVGQRFHISTRTPHAGSDFDFLVAYRLGHISTRTPHAGSDEINHAVGGRMQGFQPALPMRGVTEQVFQRDLLVDISTRTPHAGSDKRGQAVYGEAQDISTRTPHAGSD